MTIVLGLHFLGAFERIADLSWSLRPGRAKVPAATRTVTGVGPPGVWYPHQV